MYIALVIVSCLLWLAAVYCLSGRLVAAAPLSFLGLLCLSFAKIGGVPLLPVNATMLTGWLCMTLVVTLATSMQPAAIVAQSRGMGYITAGALSGMAVGLLAFTFSGSLGLRYAVMVVATVAGVFMGFLIYSRTPEGRPVDIASGHFFKYLLAKGFPAAITVMQLGVALVLALAIYNIS